MDFATNAANKQHLQAENTDNSCIDDFTVPLIRDYDGSGTAECVSGDWSAELTQENLAVVKEEPDNVC